MSRKKDLIDQEALQLISLLDLPDDFKKLIFDLIDLAYQGGRCDGIEKVVLTKLLESTNES